MPVNTHQISLLTASEVEKIRLILSTYQDGTGMLAHKEGLTLPGWRDFERSVALALGGEAQENKYIFDVLLSTPDNKKIHGISCKMRRELNRIDRDGRVTIEISNSAGKFWDYLNLQGIDQTNYKARSMEVGRALIHLIEKSYVTANIEQGGIVDLSTSYYLVLSWNKQGWYQLHQFSLTIPNSEKLTGIFLHLVIHLKVLPDDSTVMMITVLYWSGMVNQEGNLNTTRLPKMRFGHPNDSSLNHSGKTPNMGFWKK
ncbi:MAG: hypothetical protein HC889_13755 [Synechococcaceae cyanobacterium SM1_2_3]|nr:hypothetical protein [Synechococcaceae cyanobacterium SM1_2_3]